MSRSHFPSRSSGSTDQPNSTVRVGGMGIIDMKIREGVGLEKIRINGENMIASRQFAKPPRYCVGLTTVHW